MNKINSKLVLALILLIFISLPVFTTSLLDFEEQKTNEENYQKLLQEESTRKEIAKKIQEEAEEKKYLTGKFDPSVRKDFVLIPAMYTTNQSKMYLRKETFDAFLKMRDAADKGGIGLRIASATRNFVYQKNIWNNKWTGVMEVNGENLAKTIPDSLERFMKILEYSAVPSTSRHHWGTDIDINDATPEYFESKLGKKTYEWLVKNAPLFGFCQPYNLKDENRPTGYNEEKWHWSYLPLSKTFTEEYKDLIKDDDIKGFLGDENVAGQDLINNYVLGINPNCL
ncbi:MAG: D-alanyl-D-alanine carboxypeptidase family protein [Candidatus Pacebacteria bacterium]|nr:D-alanyl-D-alanine carboxypeptidase family protein [Candidatus Paceibacterota bacterium]